MLSQNGTCTLWTESSNPGRGVVCLQECTIQTKFECVKKNFADSRRIQIGTPWGGKLSNYLLCLKAFDANICEVIWLSETIFESRLFWYEKLLMLTYVRQSGDIVTGNNWKTCLSGLPIDHWLLFYPKNCHIIYFIQRNCCIKSFIWRNCHIKSFIQRNYHIKSFIRRNCHIKSFIQRNCQIISSSLPLTFFLYDVRNNVRLCDHFLCKCFQVCKKVVT